MLFTKAVLKSRPSAISVNFGAKRTGDMLIHLSQPVLQGGIDNLSFVLRILPKLGFIRNDLRDKRSTRALGEFASAFMLAEQEKLEQIEEFRQELRTTLDALIERVTLVGAPQT